MSSRNRYLSDTNRQLAPRLNLALEAAAALHQQGERDPQVLTDAFRQVLDEVQGVELEYFEIRTQSDLEPVIAPIETPIVLLTAARIGETRLIDNRELG